MMMMMIMKVLLLYYVCVTNDDIIGIDGRIPMTGSDDNIIIPR